jgi:hypothetical protein
VPDAQLLATEITEKPGDLEGEGLTQDLIDQFRKAILSFLEFDEMVENDIICKKINRQPSPTKECIFISFSILIIIYFGKLFVILPTFLSS